MDCLIRCVVVVMLTGNVMSSSFISNEGKKNKKTNSQNTLKENNLIVEYC